MASNPFFSGRIPQELLDRVEKHVQDTRESKTNILIQALAAYLEFPIQPNNLSNSTLEKRLSDLEQQVKKLLSLDKDVSEIKQIITDQNKNDNVIINFDNKEPSNQLSWLENSENKNTKIEIAKDNDREWRLVGSMNINEIIELPVLKNYENKEGLKTKIRNIKSARNKESIIGYYKIKIVGKEPGSKGKVIYEVYNQV